jgi:hypothetical protein
MRSILAALPEPEVQACLRERTERRRDVCKLLEYVEAALAPAHGPPDGTSADDYMAATDCLPDIVPNTHKRLNRILADNPTIRRWHPNPRRLMVHIGDWRRFVRERKRQDDAAVERAAEVAAEVSRVHQCHAKGHRATF